MRKRAWLVMACLWSSVFAAQPSPHAIDIPPWFEQTFLDVREDVAEAERAGKRLMIYFGQDGCPYCKALMKANFGDPAIAAFTRRHFMPVALNIWGDREVAWIDGRRMSEKSLAALLKVQYTPTLLFFDERGTVVLRLNGYLPPDRFRPALEYVGSRGEQRQSYTEYLAKLPPQAARATLTREAFFEPGASDLARLVRTSAKPLIVLFERPHCADCDTLHREGLRRPDVKALLPRFRFVQLDLTGTRPVVTPGGESTIERDWARKLTVVYAPTLLFLDDKGNEVFRAEGHLKPFHLASTLDYVASGAWREQPSFQRFIQERADALRARGESVELWK